MLPELVRLISARRRYLMTRPSGESLSVALPGARAGVSISPPRLLVDASVMLAFVAAIVGSSYALSGFPNVKLFDMLVFLAGYTLGARRGVAVAVGAWLVYGNFNPFGPSGFPLIAVLMASETAYAVAGAVARKVVRPENVRLLPSRAGLLFGAMAIASTLVYDVATNAYTGVHWATLSQSSDYARWIGVALFNSGALFFTAAHLSGNLLFFTALAPALIKAGKKLGGRAKR